MPNKSLQPVIDVFPWPNGLGFQGAEEWWLFVNDQNEKDKLMLLISMAQLSESICQLLLAHDQALFARFQLSPETIKRLCTIHADCLASYAAALIEQSNMIKCGYQP